MVACVHPSPAGPQAADDVPPPQEAHMITRLVLLGATGDMTGRFLLPALAEQAAAGRLPADVHVVGGGHQDWDDDRFRTHVAARLDEHAPGVPAAVRERLLAGMRYCRFDPADPATVARAVRMAAALPGVGSGDGRDGRALPAGTPAPAPGPAPVAVYLALPAHLFAPTLDALAEADLPPGSRIAVEKPFGQDVRSAAALNARLARLSAGDEASVSRVDHILGMPRVLDLERVRAPGGPLAAVWDGTHLAQVDVVWEETLGLGGRTGFYDGTGALKDVLQNHLLQIMALVAMEPSADATGPGRQAAKAAVLRAVRAPTPSQVPVRTRRARYTAGHLAGTGPGGSGPRPVPGYAEEPGVDPARGTETYAEVLLDVDTPRWAGTTFVLRTGKALGTPRKGLALHFRGDAPACEGAQRTGPGTLWFELDGPLRSEGRPDVEVVAPGELSAYGLVVTEVLGGGSRTAVGAEESEVAWQIVEPVLAAWRAGAVPLLEYPAGSAGPERLG